jgi:hypothetical protein
MKPLEHSLLPATKLVDVAQFFMEITTAYLDFEAMVLQLQKSVTNIPPEKILAECLQLGVERQKLATLDDQLINILNLACTEIVHTTMIHDYRVAFAKASMACGNLQQKLLAIRATLEQAGAAMHSTALFQV